MRRTLSHGDITLRPLVARDAGELYLLIEEHRPSLRRFMNWVDHTTAAADVNYYILTLDGFWGPMAYVLIGGLAVGTAITLLFVPALYALWYRLPPLAR